MKLLSSKLSICYALSLVSLLTCFTEQSKAYIITKVAAPNLSLPSNGKLYPFSIQVSGQYDNPDKRFGATVSGEFISFKAQYWDEDIFSDDEIDLTGELRIRNVPVEGNPWGPVAVNFQVGCTTNSIVFGPSGNTGENPMDDGYFRFEGWGGGFSEWGYNTVTCQQDAPDPINPPPLYRELKNIPEPTSTLSFFALGALGAGSVLKRKQNKQKSANRATTDV